MVKRWALRDELKSFAVIGWWGVELAVAERD